MISAGVGCGVARVKRGDTFALSGKADWPGVTDYRGYVAHCQIRTPTDVMICDFGATPVQSDGLYYFATDDTAGWPAYDMRRGEATIALLDVELRAPTGERRSTTTMQIIIEKDITHG